MGQRPCFSLFIISPRRDGSERSEDPPCLGAFVWDVNTESGVFSGRDHTHEKTPDPFCALPLQSPTPFWYGEEILWWQRGEVRKALPIVVENPFDF